MSSLNKKKEKDTDQRDLQHEKKIKALYILLALIFAAIFFLLGLHAVVVQSGSLLYDLSLNFFIGMTGLAIFSGLVFPLFALMMIPLMPFIVIYFYYKNKN